MTTYAPYWRPYQLSLRCTNINSSVTVNSISGKFSNIGECYQYPDCKTSANPTLIYLNDNEEDTLDLGSRFYYHIIRVSKSNPTMGQPYAGYKELPSNAALYYGNVSGLGSYVTLELTYTYGSKTKTEYGDYLIYAL